MSVYLLNPDSEVVIDSPESNNSNSGQCSNDAHQALTEFWPKVTEEIRQIQFLDIRAQNLPLARIKKIMKLDEDVKMISAEAPVLFAKAAELFIQELTLRSWVHTEDNKRRTLQRNDIAMAISKYDQFDFLIDIVPREETRSTSRNQVSLDQVHYYLQLNQAGQATSNQGDGEGSEDRQPPLGQALHEASATTNFQVIQQVVGPNGEIQQIPIAIPERQMELLRLQMESGTPLVLNPQVLQVRQPNPVYIQTLNTQQN